MFAPARYLADFARFAATKGSQERHDRQALAELERRPLELAPGLPLTWLGVSGFRFEYEGQTLQIYGIAITVAGMSFYHQSSENLIDDAVRCTDVDVFLAGVAG